MATTINNLANSSSPFHLTDAYFGNISVIIAVVVAAITYGYYHSRASKSGGIYQVPGISIITARTFFESRFDFLWSNFKYHDIFQFNVFHHKVVAISGEEARKIFFGNHHLDFTDGYKILMGGFPSFEEIDIPTGKSGQESITFFVKTLTRMVHKDRLRDALPTLVFDVDKRMAGWGQTGKIDPFVDIYNLVFQMTARLATCKDLAEDFAAVDRMGVNFMLSLQSATPATVLFPWLPTRNRKLKRQVTTDLTTMLYKQIEARKNATLTSDPIDILLSEGHSTIEIIGFVLAVIFTGVLNTGIISCWILIQFAINPQWKDKVYNEVTQLMNKHLGSDAGASIAERLASIPISAWEDEMPLLDACIRETLRINVTGAAFRRNIQDDIHVGGRVIEKGTFLTYSMADVHLNSNIYPNPEEFDPERFTVRGEDVASPMTYAYLGWGAGRHFCTGMRTAKLEMKLLVSLFILSFEYKLVDASGNFPNPLPRANRNDIHQARPIGKPCYLDYKRVAA